jgi:tRNA uridine 5-carboxymethylaminomethyl modification enzyme
MDNKFDILIIGGGHAGLEAAYAATQFSNLSIGLITLPNVPIASAPCNPSIGGVGKGQVVREIDALGGIMGRLADLAGIQFRTLNESKGYAVQSTRVQIDKEKYSYFAERELGKISNLTIIREKVLRFKNENRGFMVTTEDGHYFCKKMIMTVGTFLNGKLHQGNVQKAGGRMECDNSGSLSSFFGNIKTRSARFKTGTPARLIRDSVDYSKLEEQPSDSNTPNFHYGHKTYDRHIDQVSCYLARTNKLTMDIIRANKEKSPMFNGQITGVGARYCPSIEDKAYRYPEKAEHHIFIEPEGLELDTVYPSGISSSLPTEVQDSFLRSIEGLENCQVKVYGTLLNMMLSIQLN